MNALHRQDASHDGGVATPPPRGGAGPRPRRPRRRTWTLCAALPAALAASAAECPRSDPRAQAPHAPRPPRASARAPRVEVALGWRAREVERRSTAPVRFRHDDRGGEVLRGGPVALAYADPRHRVVLPPGAFVDLRQYAGRVYNVAATPHLAALAPDEARQLADSVARLLAGAGWAPVPGAGTGDAGAAVRAALASQAVSNPGRGAVDVGVWRVPRPPASWAALPPGTAVGGDAWNGTEALVQVRPLRRAQAGPGGAASAGRLLIVQVEFEDTALRGALSAQLEARRLVGGPATAGRMPADSAARR